MAAHGWWWLTPAAPSCGCQSSKNLLGPTWLWIQSICCVMEKFNNSTIIHSLTPTEIIVFWVEIICICIVPNLLIQIKTKKTKDKKYPKS